MGTGTSDESVTVEWVESQLRRLQRDAGDIWAEKPDVVNDFKPWSALKLIVLSGVVDIYTKIISNNNFENMFYVDLLAGTGSVQIEREGANTERFVGSPILAAAMAHEPFDHMYLVEYDQDRADALRQRMEFAADNLDYGIEREMFTIYQEDANRAVNEIMNEIQDVVYETRSAHAMAFVDNEGPNVEWDAIRRLTAVYSDLLINFPTSSLRRMVGNNASVSMSEFYGDERWRGAGTNDAELRGIYKGNLAYLDRPIQEFVRVDGSRNYFYDLIYAARETDGGNPYMEAIEHIGEQVDPLHGDDVDSVIGYMRGEATDFTPFPGEDPDQRGLGDYS